MQITQGSVIVQIVVYVYDGNNSPYQGLVQYPYSSYASITPAQIQSDQTTQYNNWVAAQTLSPAQLTAIEIAQNQAAAETYGSLATFTFNYSTIDQNIAALRTLYAPATQTAAIMLGDALNGMTDAQLQTAFGMTEPQVITLRANYLTPAVAQAAAIRAAKGT